MADIEAGGTHRLIVMVGDHHVMGSIINTVLYLSDMGECSHGVGTNTGKDIRFSVTTESHHVFGYMTGDVIDLNIMSCGSQWISIDDMALTGLV